MNAPTDSPGWPVSAALACSDIIIVKMAIDDSTGKQAPKTPATFWMLPTVKLILRCCANCARPHLEGVVLGAGDPQLRDAADQVQDEAGDGAADAGFPARW